MLYRSEQEKGVKVTSQGSQVELNNSFTELPYKSNFLGDDLVSRGAALPLLELESR